MLPDCAGMCSCLQMLACRAMTCAQRRTEQQMVGQLGQRHHPRDAPSALQPGKASHNLLKRTMEELCQGPQVSLPLHMQNAVRACSTSSPKSFGCGDV